MQQKKLKEEDEDDDFDEVDSEEERIMKAELELKAVEPDFPLKPMDVFTKQKLENQSKNMEENLKKNAKTSKDAKEVGQNTVYVINQENNKMRK